MKGPICQSQSKLFLPYVCHTHMLFIEVMSLILKSNTAQSDYQEKYKV